MSRWEPAHGFGFGLSVAVKLFLPYSYVILALKLFCMNGELEGRGGVSSAPSICAQIIA